MMKDGAISQAGTHEELMTAGGDYKKLYQFQMELEQYGKEARG